MKMEHMLLTNYFSMDPVDLIRQQYQYLLQTGRLQELTQLKDEINSSMAQSQQQTVAHNPMTFPGEGRTK